jgi:hypothetical protein
MIKLKSLLLEANLKGLIAKAIEYLYNELLKHEIEDKVTVKIKPFKPVRQKHWLAMYKSGTALRGGRPIFWVNDNFLKIVINHLGDDFDALMVLKDTLVHEYGHVIYEWATTRKSNDKNAAQAMNLLKSFGDEENYAENFSFFISGRDRSKANIHEKIIDLYKHSVGIETYG